MNDIAKIVYEKFFMRDLLGKILPGTIISLAILSSLGITDTSKIIPFQELRSLLWLFILAWSILAGLALQILGELIGFHSASPRPQRILFFIKITKWYQVNEDFRERLSLIRNASDEQWTSGAKEQRERFVYLKEGSGNLALALLVLFLRYMFSGSAFYPLPMAILLFAIILYWSHLIHATRQAFFEIRTLEQSSLLTSEKAQAMSERIRNPVIS